MRQGCRGGVELPRQRHEDVGQAHLDQKQPSERWRVRLLLASGLGGGLSLELSALLLRLARRPQVSYPGSGAGGSRPRKWDPLSGLRSATAQPGTWATTSAVRASVSASFCPTIARGTPRTARSRGWGAPPCRWAQHVGAAGREAPPRAPPPARLRAGPPAAPLSVGGAPGRRGPWSEPTGLAAPLRSAAGTGSRRRGTGRAPGERRARGRRERLESEHPGARVGGCWGPAGRGHL